MEVPLAALVEQGKAAVEAAALDPSMAVEPELAALVAVEVRVVEEALLRAQAAEVGLQVAWEAALVAVRAQLGRAQRLER